MDSFGNKELRGKAEGLFREIATGFFLVENLPGIRAEATNFIQARGFRRLTHQELLMVMWKDSEVLRKLEGMRLQVEGGKPGKASGMMGFNARGNIIASIHTQEKTIYILDGEHSPYLHVVRAENTTTILRYGKVLLDFGERDEGFATSAIVVEIGSNVTVAEPLLTIKIRQ